MNDYTSVKRTDYKTWPAQAVPYEKYVCLSAEAKRHRQVEVVMDVDETGHVSLSIKSLQRLYLCHGTPVICTPKEFDKIVEYTNASWEKFNAGTYEIKPTHGFIYNDTAAPLQQRIYTVMPLNAAARDKAQKKYSTGIHGYPQRVGKPVPRTASNTATAAQRLALRFKAILAGQPLRARVKAQSGWASREEREVAQRRAAFRKQEATWKKQFNKDERKRLVRAARDKRNVAFQEELPEAMPYECEPPAHHEIIRAQGLKNLSVPLGALGGAAAGFLMRKLFRTASEVSKVVQKTSQFIDSATDAVGDVSVLSKKTGSLVDTFTTMLKDFAASLEKHVGILSSAAVAVVGYVLLKNYCKNPLMKTVLLTAMAFVVGAGYMETLASHIPFLSTKEVAEAQSGVGTTLSRVLAVALASTVFKRKADIVWCSGEFLKRLTNIGRAAEGAEKLGEWLVSALSALHSWLMKLFGKEAKPQPEDAVLAWRREVYEMERDVLSMTEPVSPAQVTRFVELLNIGTRYRTLYHHNPMRERMISETLVKVSNMMRPHIGALASRNNFRLEPVCMVMHGGPGCGKTLLMQSLATLMLKLTGLVKPGATAKDCSAEIWQKGTSEFWNGYAGQTCLVLDDLWQAKATKTTEESEFLMFIKMVSTWAYPLNFADLESKGKIYFGSKIVLATTNLASIASEAKIQIQEPDAVARRISFGWHLIVNPAYVKNGRLDYEKFFARRSTLSNESGLDRFPWEVWSVQKHNFITGMQEGEPRPLREAVMEMVDTVKNRISKHGEESAFQDDWCANIDVECALRDSNPQAAARDTMPGVTAEATPTPPVVSGETAATEQVTAQAGSLSANVADDSWSKARPKVVRTTEAALALSAAPHFSSPAENAAIRALAEFDEKMKLDHKINKTMGQIRYELIAEPLIREIMLLAATEWPHRYFLFCYDSHYIARKVLKSFIEKRVQPYEFLEQYKQFLKRRPEDEESEIERITIKNTVRGVAFASLHYLSYDADSIPDDTVDEEWYEDRQRGLKRMYSWFCEKFSDPSMGLLVQTAIAVAIVIVIKTIQKWMGKGKKKKIKPQSNVPLTPGTRINYQKNKKQVVAQSGQEREVIVEKVAVNSYNLKFAPHKGWTKITHMGTVTFITGTMAMFPDHFFCQMADAYDQGAIVDDTELQFTHTARKDLSFTLKYKDFANCKRWRLEDEDLCFMLFPVGTLRAHGDITKFFIKDADVPYVQNHKGRLDIYEPRFHMSDGSILSNRTIMVASKLKYMAEIEYPPYRCGQCFEYEGAARQGDCGSMMTFLAGESFGCRSIIGIHVAGSGRHGYIKTVTQELLSKAQVELSAVRDEFFTDIAERAAVRPQCGGMPFLRDALGFEPLVELEKPVPLAPNTKLKPTPLYGRFGEQTDIPMKLGPYFEVAEDGMVTYIKPMEEAIAKYGALNQYRDLPDLRASAYVAFVPLFRETETFSRVILTPEQAVVGVPQMKLRAIPRGTSAGWPECQNAQSGKKHIFGKDLEYDVTGPEWQRVKKRVLYVVEQAKKNIRCAHVFMGILKDELRAPHKQARYISCSPLDYTIAFRMYFGAFTAALFSVNVKTGMAPGVCVYSQWNDIAVALRSKGIACFDGDFKGFDTAQEPQVLEAILEVVNRWYGDSEENQMVRRVLWQDLIHSRHLGGDGRDQRYVYEWSKSLPSGHPFTTVVNSMYSLLMLVYAFRHIHPRLDFWTHVAPMTFGDDNMCNTSDEVAATYNQKTVAETVSKLFGMEYTPSNKGAELSENMKLEDISFLRRKFYYEKGAGWLCPLELESFMYSCYWCKNQKELQPIMEANLETCLEELSLHPPPVWEEWAPQVITAMGEIGAKPKQLPERGVYQALVRSRTDNWY